MKRTLATHILTLSLLLPSTCLLLAAGCSQEQLASVDRLVADANHVGQGVAAIAEGPAAPLLPPGVPPLLVAAALLGELAYGTWQKIRASRLLEKNSALDVTLKAVVDGVEISGAQADPVKQNIREIMRDREVYTLANAVVDQARSRNPKINARKIV